jgi:hypothetical protein
MLRLNRQRVGLKHHGIVPSLLDIRGFEGAVDAFFADNMPMLFGTSLEQISVAGLVPLSSVREALLRAEVLDRSGNRKDACEQLGSAFARLVAAAESTAAPFREPYLRRPTGYDMEDMSSGFVRCVELLYESVEALRRDVAELRMGVNVQDLSRFRQFTPIVHFTAGGEHAYWPNRSREPSDEEYRFCTDFVISNALRLQASIVLDEQHAKQ